MSQKIKEFVRQSGVEVTNSNSNENNNFARELEEDLLRADRERTMRRAGFRTPPRPQFRPRPRPRPEPLANEFADVNEKMIENILKEIDEPVPPPPLSNNNMRELFAPTNGLQIGALNPGMFNATVNREFGKENRIDLTEILKKRPLPRTSIGNGLYVDTKEIKGWFGQFKTGFSHTRNYGMQGNLNKNFFSVQITLEVSNGEETKGATVNIYRNGKIRFSGGFVGPNIVNQPERIRRFVVDSYTNKDSFLYNPFSYNNLSGQFRINGFFDNMEVLASRFRKYGMTRVSYEPELSPFIYAYFDNATFILSKTGNVQISGAKNPEDMVNAYEFGKKFIQDLNADGQIRVTGVFGEGVKAKTKTKPKTKVNTKPKATPSVRMKKSELVNIARKMGVVNFRAVRNGATKALTKEELYKRIQNKSGNKTASFKNTSKNKNVSLSGSGKTFRVGKVKCENLSKKELTRIAVILKIKPNTKETKTSLCNKIEKVRNNLSKPKPPPPPPKPKPTKKNVVATKRNVKKAEVMKKRGLDENSIRKDLKKLYGDKWMKRYNPNLNQDVRNMKSALNAINKGNKLGVPFKKDVDQIKKNVVSRWKMERRRELERKYLMNTVNVTGIAYNLRNDYRRAAANYIMSKKTLPSNKKMVEYRNYWLKFRANMNTNGNSRRVNRTARARVEKI
jgi:TATA-box binding protein (TBP) (component of TFIID and TFIIIB)